MEEVQFERFKRVVDDYEEPRKVSYTVTFASLSEINAFWRDYIRGDLRNHIQTLMANSE